MANIAIIPARGGSKRIPKKNIKDFFGKPLIAYSIQYRIELNLKYLGVRVSKIYVEAFKSIRRI